MKLLCYFCMLECRHSAGCLVALQSFLDAPEKVGALILVAPALAAPIILEEVEKAANTPDPGIGFHQT